MLLALQIYSPHRNRNATMSSIKPIFQPYTSSRPTQDTREGGNFTLAGVLRNNFNIHTWVLIGASLQALAVYLFSTGHYVLLISTMVLLVKGIQTFLQAQGIMKNPYMEGVIPGRYTALLPDLDADTAENAITAPASRKIVCFHLGAKSNHPYGYFAPQFQQLGGYLGKMIAAMDAAKVPGFLGQTTFNRTDAKGAPETVLISYWDSTEALWAFAHSDVHKEGWLWWEKTIKENGYVGINHEVFEADAKNWENIYANFQPTMMAATTHVVKGGKIEGGVVDDKWISGLVGAARGPLARSSGRMGRPITMHDESKGERPTYE